MYKAKMYVFGGHHTTQALHQLICFYSNAGDRYPHFWENYPAEVFALPGPFSDYTTQLDIVGELDNEPIARQVSCLDRVRRARFRFEFPEWQAYVNASSDQ